MNTLQRCLVWFGGYAPRTLAEVCQEDLEPITKIGGAVIFASVVALINWGVAGWTYAEGAANNTRLYIAIAAGSFGFFMAALFDRSFVYFADTAIGGSLKFLSFWAARVAIIIAIGSMTSQTVIPLLFDSELKIHALQLSEESEKKRVGELNARFGVGKQEGALKAATDEIERLKSAASNLPPDLQQQILAAKKCWDNYHNQRWRLIKSGFTASEANRRLGKMATMCASKTRAAEVARNDYFARARAQLDQAVESHQTRERELADTKSIIKGKVENAGKVEEESLNPKSAVVLWSLLESNYGARLKWALITFLLLVFELLPLILKFQAGQSNIGRRISKNRFVNKLSVADQIKEAEHNSKISATIHMTSMQAIDEALANPAVRSIFSQTFASYISAVAPTEAVRTIMREIETRHVNIEEFLQRFPKYASIVTQALSKAVKDATEILAHGV